MSSSLRRSGTKLMRILSQAANPAITGVVTLFGRDPSPGSVLSVRRGGVGIPVQLIGINAEGLPKGYVVNLMIARTGVTGLELYRGAARSDDDEFDIFLGVTQTIDLTTVGANGLDAGALAANTWYAVYAIGDSTGVLTGAGLVSTSFAAPVLPAGYDKKRRVGVMLTDAASQVTMYFVRHGGRNGAFFIPAGIRSRRYYWDLSTALRLSGGTATVFTSVSFATDIPPTSRRALLEARFSPGTLGAATDELELRPAGANAADGPVALRRGTNLTAGIIITGAEVSTDANQAIEYKVTQGGANQNQASLRCVGFVDEI